MGDVAMSAPIIKSLVEQNPLVKITVLTRGFFKPFFEDIPNVRVVIPDLKGGHKGFFGLVKLYKELSKQSFDAVADLHNVLRSKVLVGLFRLSGVRCVQLDKGRSEKKQLTTLKVKKLHQLPSMHERYAKVFRKLGFKIELGTGFKEKAEITNEFREVFKDKKLVGFAPFAAFKGKSFSVEKTKELLKELSVVEQTTVLLFGGGGKEKAILEEIAADYENVISMVGKISFVKELEIISNLDTMIAMDSGNGHLAAMYGVPVITVWGVTHPCLGFVPYNQPKENQILPDLERFPLVPTSVYGNKSPENYLDCIASIDSKNLVKRVRLILT
ncbi:hypothetical protein WH52_13085 [Tenacibaculum holothuriorum]|uniref:Heptosyltransferase n=2 Tax=Tenacibaculum holothuriorum TaxID=1635173 RepID=A0A1Y2PAZ6_9FLAO|nr:hypothetical protein WH52_13085 [Tenacibaculum holothuriorum]